MSEADSVKLKLVITRLDKGRENTDDSIGEHPITLVSFILSDYKGVLESKESMLIRNEDVKKLSLRVGDLLEMTLRKRSKG